MEEWQSLEDLGFSSYSVSNYGDIRNNATGRVLSPSKNNTGHAQVHMYHDDGDRRTLEVARLVADKFVPGRSERDSSPIYLNGNKRQPNANNLAWRPRWFAVLYHAQFRSARYRINAPIVEVTTERLFENSLEAAIAFGILERDIILSTTNHNEIFPTGHSFRFLSQMEY